MNLGEIVVKITGDSSQFSSQIKNAEKQTKSFSDIAKNMGGNLTKFVTLPILGLGTAAVKTAADIEKQKVAFGVLLQDVEKGNKLFKQLQEFSAKTPLQLEDITKGTQRLLAFGTQAEDVIDRMTRLGDLAQGNGPKLDSLTNAYGKLQAKGKASLEEINMFTENGVPLMDALAKTIGVTTQEVFKLVSDGKVGFSDVEKAIKSLTSEGGQFFGLMDKTSQTMSGKFSTAMDNLKLAAAELGQIMLPVAKDIIDNITQLAQSFISLDDDTKKMILTIGGIALAVGPVISGITGIIGVVGSLKTAFIGLKAATLGPIGAIGAAVAAVTFGVIALSDAIKKQTEHIKNYDKQVKEMQENLQRWRKTNPLLEKEMRNLEKELGNTGSSISSATELVKKFAGQINAGEISLADFEKELKGNMLITIEDVKKAMEELGLEFKSTNQVSEEYQTVLNKLSEVEKNIGLLQVKKNQNLIDEQELISQTISEYEDLIDVIQEQGFTQLEGTISQETIDKINELKQELEELQEKEIEIMQQEEEAQRIKNNSIAIQKQFNFIVLSDFDKRIAKLDEEKKLYIDAGIEKVEVERWYSNEVAKIYADREKQKEEIIRAEKDFEIESLKEIEKRREEIDKKQRDQTVSTRDLQIKSAEQISEKRKELFEAEKIRIQEEKDFIFTALSELYSSLTGMINTYHQTKLNNLNAEHQQEDEADKILLQNKIDAINEEKELAIKKGKDKEKAEKEALEKIDAVQEAYNKKDLERRQETAALQQQEFEYKKAVAIGEATMSAYTSAVKIYEALSFLGPVAAGVGAAAAAAFGLGQVALIASQQPPPIPQLAEGGIVMPTQGGVLANIAEAGQPEAVIPLDQLDQLINGGQVQVTINFDSDMIFDKIFEGTRNKKILIDSGALV